MSPTGWLWLAIGSTALGAVFAALFHSLKDMSRAKLDELSVSKGNAPAQRRVERILDDVGSHSVAVALPRTLCNMIAAVAVVYWVDGIRGTALSSGLAITIGLAVASVVIWVFGLVVPHSVARYAAEGTIYTWSWLIRLSHLAYRPVSGLATFFDEVVRRLTGSQKATGAETIEAELMSVVEEGQQGGQFDQVERNMIEAVMGFSRTTVEQIMTPRTEMEALELTNNLGEITRFIRGCRHSRIPVFEGGMDHVVGMFYVKDLLRWLAGDGPRTSGKPFELKAILRPAYFVPETKTIRELLQELIDKKVHVAMVADEYGGTSGLVTLEDIVEEIFGEIQDEYEQTEDAAAEVHVDAAEHTADLDARAYIRDVNMELKALGVELPEGEDYDTVGGLVVTSLGRIPEVGESMRMGPTLITVMEAEPTRVNRVRLEVKEEAAPAEEIVVKPDRVEQET